MECVKFLKRTGMNERRFGMLAIGNPNLMKMMRRGHEFKVSVEIKVNKFMREWESGQAE